MNENTVVFEVTTQHSVGDSNEIITTHTYATAYDDRLSTVVDYWEKHCEQYEKDLKGVREVVIITNYIPAPEDDPA